MKTIEEKFIEALGNKNLQELWNMICHKCEERDAQACKECDIKSFFRREK